MIPPAHGEVGGRLRGKGDTGAESVIVVRTLTSRSSVVLKNVFFVRTYCFGCQVIPTLSACSVKERPALEGSLSIAQNPPPHQVTAADQ